MSYNVSNLTPFVDQTKFDLISKAVVGNPSLQYLNVVPGITYKAALNKVLNSITVQAGGCGWNPLGTITFSQREVEVKPLKVNDSVCQETLDAYWMAAKMHGNPDDYNVAPEIAETYISQIQTDNEFNIWQGNFTGSTSAITYDNFDGFLKIIAAEPTRLRATALLSASTLATIIQDVETMYSYIPESIRMRNDVYLYMPYSDWNKYRNALATANLYHYDATGLAKQMEINYIQGLTVIATPGLAGIYSAAGLPCWVLSYKENMVVGTDLMNRYESIDVRYSYTLQYTQIIAKWKMGVQVYFPELIVTNF